MTTPHVNRRSVAFTLNVVFALTAAWLCGSAIEADWQRPRTASHGLAIASINKDLFVAMHNLRTGRGMAQMLMASRGPAMAAMISGIEARRTRIGTREVSSNIISMKLAATDAGRVAANVLGAATRLSRQAEELTGGVNQFVEAMKAA